MKYLLMIYEDRAPYASASQEGKMLAGNALQPSNTATTVRIDKGKRICRLHTWNHAALEVRPIMEITG